jgi:hypothetical protein
MSVVPNTFGDAKGKVGCLIALACSGRLITPELVIAMSMQPMPTHMGQAFLGVRGYPVEEAREIIARKAIECQAKYLWFIDDDTIPPPNTANTLMNVLNNNPDIAAIGGVYVTKSDPPTPVVFRGMGLGAFWHWKKGEIFEVTGIGAGCLMINCEIFKKLEPPYFPWYKSESSDPLIPSLSVSEDISFCNKVREAGYKVFAHGGVICDHFDVTTGKTYQMPEDSYPMREEFLIDSNGIVVPNLKQYDIASEPKVVTSPK